ncbi:MAG: hypothetical protein GC168_05145 [Candidatus Hydrogenedens sp.]|nr:hypothetical protein [Candidatus Hydrogenedens sp.]
MFGWFKRKIAATRPPTLTESQAVQPARNRRDAGQVRPELLSQFLEGGATDYYTGNERWIAALGGNPAKAINRLVSEGLLCEASPATKLRLRFKVSELKPKLKERGLKVSGKKDALIERLLEHDPEGMIQITRGVSACECTERGREMATAYLDERRAKRAEAFAAMTDALARKEYREAAMAVARYEAGQVFGRITPEELPKYKASREVRTLKSIYGRPPKILKSVPDERLGVLRIAAAEMVLWGTNYPSETIPEGFETGNHMDPASAARMFIFFAGFQEDIRQLKQCNVRTVEVLGGGEHSCAACNKIAGRKYPINEVPEIPHADCTMDCGCRCCVVMGEI